MKWLQNEMMCVACGIWIGYFITRIPVRDEGDHCPTLQIVILVSLVLPFIYACVRLHHWSITRRPGRQKEENP